MFTAWQTAKFGSFTERLEPLGYHLEKLKPVKPRRQQSPSEMIAALRAIKASKERMN